MGKKERAGAVVVELATIIALDTQNGDTKMRGNIGKEIRQGGKSVRL